MIKCFLKKGTLSLRSRGWLRVFQTNSANCRGACPNHGVSCTHNIGLPASFKMFVLLCMHGCLYFITAYGDRKFGMESTGSYGLIWVPYGERGPRAKNWGNHRGIWNLRHPQTVLEHRWPFLTPARNPASFWVQPFGMDDAISLMGDGQEISLSSCAGFRGGWVGTKPTRKNRAL